LNCKRHRGLLYLIEEQTAPRRARPGTELKIEKLNDLEIHAVHAYQVSLNAQDNRAGFLAIVEAMRAQYLTHSQTIVKSPCFWRYLFAP
jgi:hypothetical protein